MSNRDCCDRPAITRMMKAPAVNDICTSCGSHWFGKGGRIRRFTRAQWDAWIEAGYRKQLAADHRDRKAHATQRA